MLLDVLPPEILDIILGFIDDVYEFMRLSQVCKSVQTAVRSRVLVLSDTETQSRLFSSICGNCIHISDSSQISRRLSEISKYGFYIVECSGMSRNNDYYPHSLISSLLSHSHLRHKKIVRALISRDTIESLKHYRPKFSSTVGPRQTEFLEDSMKHVSKTICYLPEIDYGLFGKGHLEIMGHDYDFINIISLPKIYFHVNEKYDFRIRSKQIISLDGISNTTMGKPRLPPLLKFLELSELPNLTSIHDVSIETGFSLQIFERFKNLKFLSLQSAFTGNIQLQISKAPEEVTLRNLETLKVIGNAISLSCLRLPELYELRVELYGSNERSISESLFFEDVDVPLLDKLHLEIGPLPGGLDYISRQLKEFIPRVTNLTIISDVTSFHSAFKCLKFDSLRKLRLKTNNFAIRDLPNALEPENIQTLSYQIDSKFLKFPKLQALDILDFDRFNSSFIKPDVHFPRLTDLRVRFKVLHDPQYYEFKPENFPMLMHLTIKYGNRYGPLKESDIRVKIGKLRSLVRIVYDSSIHLEVDKDLKDVLQLTE